MSNLSFNTRFTRILSETNEIAEEVAAPIIPYFGMRYKFRAIFNTKAKVLAYITYFVNPNAEIVSLFRPIIALLKKPIERIDNTAAPDVYSAPQNRLSVS